MADLLVSLAAFDRLNRRYEEALAERDRYRQALTFIAVGDLPGQYLDDFLADRMSTYAKDVLDGKGQLQVFPGEGNG